MKPISGWINDLNLTPEQRRDANLKLFAQRYSNSKIKYHIALDADGYVIAYFQGELWDECEPSLPAMTNNR